MGAVEGSHAVEPVQQSITSTYKLQTPFHIIEQTSNRTMEGQPLDALSKTSTQRSVEVPEGDDLDQRSNSMHRSSFSTENSEWIMVQQRTCDAGSTSVQYRGRGGLHTVD